MAETLGTIFRSLGAQVTVEELPDVEAALPAWRRLERRAPPPSPYETAAWLSAWTSAYGLRRPVLVRVGSGEAPTALGLIERGRGGRWRFAGFPVTPVRRLLAAPREEERAWNALGAWLEGNSRRWSLLEAEGIQTPPSQFGAAVLAPEPWSRISLPATFNAYMAARPPGARKGLKQKLRRAERAGARVVQVPPEGQARALEAFVTLHSARAADKGERHPGMDERAARLLGGLNGGPDDPLRLFELRVEGATAAVCVMIDHGEGTYFYNAGFDSAYAALGPGLVVLLGVVRHAIDDGRRWIDLGPGSARYKRDLGGEEWLAVGLGATSPSARGAALGLSLKGVRAGRDLLLARPGRRRSIFVPRSAARGPGSRGSSTPTSRTPR